MKTLSNPYYYLDNFQQVLDWVGSRYADLLTASELAWLRHFRSLPQASRAMLVRLIMRKGSLFRSGKLLYPEIGCTQEAMRPLLEAGWIDDNPLLDIDQLYGLLTREELRGLLKDAAPRTALTKPVLLAALRMQYQRQMTFMEWQPETKECIYALSEEVAQLSDRLRLMFFGNLHQDWTEFVLAELGIYQYEKVTFDETSRAFLSREDVDAYLHLHACREQLAAGAPTQQVLGALQPAPAGNEWLGQRHARLLFQIAQQAEKDGELDQALAIYRDCKAPGARLRVIRILEKMNDSKAAHALAEIAAKDPESQEESQHLERILPRLRRKLGLPSLPVAAAVPVDICTIVLPKPAGDFTVEEEVRRQLDRTEAPAFHVENTLINALFGLLCWEAIFHPVPGAFFHPFHAGPADLSSSDFHARRVVQFAACFAQLESGHYKATIRNRYHEKWGVQSPFVFWEALSEPLLDLALACIPAQHLRHWFTRMLQDVRNNRHGFPDLIQFWPAENRYRMIEVKGPGDRLQDNQIRMLRFAHAHGIPVSVCHVRWTEEPA